MLWVTYGDLSKLSTGKSKMIDELSQSRIIPVITLESLDDAEPLALALKSSGMKILEITLRTPIGMAAAKLLAQDSELIVGIGSVVSQNELEIAKSNGIKFAVSPGTNLNLIRESVLLGLQYLPGVSTPSEIMQCLDEGIEFMKYFPAEILGGINGLKAMSAPFPSVKFVPTGGLSEKNFISYLKCKNVVAIGGSWMVSSDLIQNKDYQSISSIAQTAMNLVAHEVNQQDPVKDIL